MAVTRHASVPTASANVHYTLAGSGPGLVMVHGSGADGQTTFGELATRFTGRHTVLLPDLSDTGTDLTVEVLADQVAATIAHAGLDAVDLLGFSLGSAVAVGVAAARPDLVRRLVLVGGWIHRDEYINNLMSVWLRLADDPDAFGRYAAITAYSPAYLNALTPEEIDHLVTVVKPTPITLRLINLNLRLDIRALLPSIRAETLVIGCTDDHTIPVSNARALHAAIPHSTYAELTCGHVAHVEREAEFLALINRANQAQP